MAKNQKSEEPQIEAESGIEVQTEAQIEEARIQAEKVFRAQIKVEVLEALPSHTKAYITAISPIQPADLTLLKEALKTAEEAHTKAMKGDVALSPTANIEAYQTATNVRDEARKALKSAESMTSEEACKASLNAHNYLVSLHNEVAEFDQKHGISYSIEKKGRKSSANGITKAEFESIPMADRIAYKMSLSDDGTMTVNGHSCRTMSTWKRHAEA